MICNINGWELAHNKLTASPRTAALTMLRFRLLIYCYHSNRCKHKSYACHIIHQYLHVDLPIRKRHITSVEVITYRKKMLGCKLVMFNSAIDSTFGSCLQIIFTAENCSLLGLVFISEQEQTRGHAWHLNAVRYSTTAKVMTLVKDILLCRL